MLEEGKAGIKRKSKVALDQIRSVDKRRLGNKTGEIGAIKQGLIDVAIKISLALVDRIDGI